MIVSCNAEGRMIRGVAGKRQAFTVVLDDAVNDRGLAMTSSFSNMVVFGQCMAHIHNPTLYEPILSRLVKAGKTLLRLPLTLQRRSRRSLMAGFVFPDPVRLKAQPWNPD
jgi:hypothetical protein